MLWRLLNHKDAKNFDIKVLVRNAEKAKLLQEKFGVQAVVGSHADLDKIEALAEEADYVITTVRKVLLFFLRAATDRIYRLGRCRRS